MADKTLRIIFNGISTLWPGPPMNGGKPVHKAFVMMAANQEPGGKRGKQVNEWGTTIPKHFPFVRVARSALVDPPWPDETAVVSEGGEHWVYFFEDARIVIHAPERRRGTRIEYFIDPDGHPLADRPGSDNVALPSDIRWLADVRDILSKPAPLKETANPDQPYVGEEVAGIVNLDRGVLKANFPCATVSPQTFVDAKTKKAVPGFRRALADEIVIEIPFAKDTAEITLEFKQLRLDTPTKGPKELVLRWPHQEALLVVRMGNDSKEEMRRLDTPERCDPVRRTGPVLKPRDDDFDLHYNFLQIPDKVGRPLPQVDIRQCDFPGCKPLMIGGGDE